MGPGWRAGLVAMAVVAISACGHGTGGPPPPAPPEDAGTPAPADGGVIVVDPDFGKDAGVPPPAVDGGTAPDAGTGTTTALRNVVTAYDAGTVVAVTSAEGWTLIGGADADGPREVRGVTSDDAGNIWVAGGADGLFLLRPGETRFTRFTHLDGLTAATDDSGDEIDQPVLSVQGGAAGVVYVGYQGLPNCDYEWETSNFDPTHARIYKSGDADRVVLGADGTLTVSHYDISSPPGYVSNEPQGREKICHVLRIAYDRQTNTLWFGGNHGVAWGDPESTRVEEHVHPNLDGYTSETAPRSTFLSDSYFGVAVQPNGDLFLGGSNRAANFRATSIDPNVAEGRTPQSQPYWNFWNADLDMQQVTKLDVWPDAVDSYARPSQRTDDNVSDMASDGIGSVWVASFTNGLAHVTGSQRADGYGYATAVLKDTAVEPNGKASALELDPKDGSLWVGYVWGGLTRLKGGEDLVYDGHTLGGATVSGGVWDIQSDLHGPGGQRRILVGFRGSLRDGTPGMVGIYTGD